MKSININGRKIPYILTRKPVKNINIRVKPDKIIYVSANKMVSEKYIKQLLHSKEDFIINALEKYDLIKEHKDKQNQLNTGEELLFLGKRFLLTVIKSDEEFIVLKEDYAYLYVNDPQCYERKKAVIDLWLQNQCQKIFHEINLKVHDIFKKYGVALAPLKIKKMVSRYGSCHLKQGHITMNIKLIQAPITCIEYVMLHEYAHFIHPNHSKKFHQFVQTLMPDYKERIRTLKSPEYSIKDL